MCGHWQEDYVKHDMKSLGLQPEWALFREGLHTRGKPLISNGQMSKLSIHFKINFDDD